ncbi:DUF1758 domain-containing protein [Trichonephila clavipes]|nr:DUF1758 domain-containing protein [Trichonephila clavipes]
MGPVFDASSREKGNVSLNQCLFTGPNLLELIPDIIDRFRLYPIGLNADIEKAFLQLEIAPKDRDYLRFFYPCDEEVIYRHCRVVFGVSSSPFLLNASIKHLLDNSPSEFSDSDSTVALWWIIKDDEWSIFVTNGVKEIRQFSHVQSWRHVPGNMNPADVLSRACSPKKCRSLNGGTDLHG